MLRRSLVGLAAALFLLPTLLAPVSSGPLSMSEATSPRVPAEVRDLVAATGRARVGILLTAGAVDDILLLAAALRSAGAAEVAELPAAGGILANVNEAALSLLAADERVLTLGAFTGGETLAAECAFEPAPPATEPWWLGEMTGVEKAHEKRKGPGEPGKDRLVVILDSGVALTPRTRPSYYAAQGNGVDPVRNALGWKDLWGEGVGTIAPQPEDACGHGTAVASVITDPDTGVAPGAKWIAARIVRNPDTDTTVDMAWNALLANEWIMRTLIGANKLPVDAVVNSWGLDTGEYSPAVTQLITNSLKALEARGVAPIFAAGNAPDASVTIPADYPEAIAVGMVDSEGNDQGSHGPGRHRPGGAVLQAGDPVPMKPDLSAPGVGLVAEGRTGDRALVAGSSYAAPFAAGIALLAREQAPHLSGAALRDLLKGSSGLTHYPAAPVHARPNPEVGYGILDAEVAFDAAVRSSELALIGAGQGTGNRDLFTSAGYHVTAFPATERGIEEVEERLDSFGLIVVDHFSQDRELLQELDDLIQKARRKAVGLLLLGEASSGSYDGVEAYLKVVHDRDAEKANPGQGFSGKVVDNRTFARANATGTEFSLRSGSNPSADSFTLLDFTEVVESSPGGKTYFASKDPAWSSKQDPDSSDRSRVALLANAGIGTSQQNTPRTAATERHILAAADWVGASAINVSVALDPRVRPALGEILVVGDLTGALVELAGALRYTVEAVGSGELDRVGATLAAAQRGLAPLRLVVYNDVAPDSPGAPSLASIEAQRLALRAPALVLGASGTAALDRLQDSLGYSVCSDRTGEGIAPGVPHLINDFGVDHDPVAPSRSVARFTLPSGWSLVYDDVAAPASPCGTDAAPPVTAAAVYAGSSFTPAPIDPVTGLPPPGVTRAYAAVLGIGAAPDPVAGPLSASERALISRAISWLVREEWTTDLEIGSDEDLSDPRFPIRKEGEVYVIKGLRFFKSGETPILSISGTTKDILIVNSVFESGPARRPGILLRDNEGKVTIEGNTFYQRDAAIDVDADTAAEIHHNKFISNYRAIVYTPNSLTSIQPLKAQYNYFDTFSPYQAGSTLMTNTLGVAGSPTQSPPDPNRRTTNDISTGVSFVPFYTRSDFTDPYPATDDPQQFVVDEGTTSTTQYLVATPSYLRILYLDGREFAFTATDLSSQVVTSSASSGAPPGWVSRDLVLPPGAYNFQVTAVSGGGDYYLLSAPLSVPTPSQTFLAEPFGTPTPSGWTLSGSARRSASPGYGDAAGFLEVGPAAGTATRSVTADPYGTNLVAYVRPTAGSAGTLRLDWLIDGSPTPVLALPFTSAGIDRTGWMEPAEDRPLAAGSWHKVEARLDPPWADVYLNNVFLGAAPVLNAPLTAGHLLPLRVSLEGTAGTLGFDGVEVYRGETLAGTPTVLDFETAGEPVAVEDPYATPGGGASGNSLIIRDDDGTAEHVMPMNYWDDYAIKSVTLPETALHSAASARLWVYAHAGQCTESATPFRFLVRGSRVADVNPCAVWPTDGNPGWASLAVPLSSLAAGAVNTFELHDEWSNWEELNLFVALDQTSPGNQTDARTDGNRVRGELMWYLEIEKSSSTSSGGGGSGGRAGVLDGGGAATQIESAHRLERVYRTESATPATAGPSGAASGTPESGDEVDVSRFARTGGSPAYGNGQSLFIDQVTPGSVLTAPLTGQARTYFLEEYVSIPADTSYAGFLLMRIADATGASILDLAFEDDNTHLDIRGEARLPNVAHLAPRQWHKLTAAVTGGDYTVFVDDVPVATGTLAKRAAPAKWVAAEGVGAAIFDNIRFGYGSRIQSDPSRSGAIDAGWTVLRASTTPAVKTVTQIPEYPLPSEKVDNPLLASHGIRIVSAPNEADTAALRRALPETPGRAYAASLAFYLPPTSTVVPAFDGFKVWSVEDASGFLFSIGFHNSDETLDLCKRGTSTCTSTGITIARGKWNLLRASVGPTGAMTVTVNGAAIPAVPVGGWPTALTLGDTSARVEPLTAGATGYGEAYFDDLRIDTLNTKPTVTIGQPGGSSTVGGLFTVSGTAADADLVDAISKVDLILKQGATTVLPTFSAEGTTAWSRTIDSANLPYGSYTLQATSHDGREASATTSRTFTIDNRPTGGISSPTAGSSIGGLVTVSGTAKPRFPRSEGEEVDSLKYAIDNGPWTLLVPVAGQWSFSWSTPALAKGSHEVKVVATKGLDSSTWIATYTVDNSPSLAIESPTANQNLGGYVTFRGTAQDRYVLAPNDTVDTLEGRIDTGPWAPLVRADGPNGAVAWTLPIDTHLLTKGSHTFTVRGMEDGDERTASVTFNTDNTPSLTILTPEGNSNVGDRVGLRGSSVDSHPSGTAAGLPRVYVRLDGGAEVLATSVANETTGRVDWHLVLDVKGVPNGAHTLTVRAVDGQDSRSLSASVTVTNGAVVALSSGKYRYDYLDGAGQGDRYTMSVGSDATELRINLRAFVNGSAPKLYLRYGGEANETVHDAVSTGNATDQEVFLTPLTGLRSGTFYLRVQADGAATDYRVVARVATVSCGCTTGGGIIPRELDNDGLEHAQGWEIER